MRYNLERIILYGFIFTVHHPYLNHRFTTAHASPSLDSASDPKATPTDESRELREEDEGQHGLVGGGGEGGRAGVLGAGQRERSARPRRLGASYPGE